MSTTRVVVVFSALALVAGAAFAKNEGKWPKDAVALSAADVTAFFAGHTVDFRETLYYFSPDGSLVGYHKDKKGDGFADGNWDVNGNEFCLHSSWHGKDKSAAPFLYTWCNKLMKAKKVVWAQNTKSEDQYLNDIYTGLDKKLKKGDLVSKKIATLKTRYGY